VERSVRMGLPQTRQQLRLIHRRVCESRFHVSSLSPKRRHQYTLACFVLAPSRFRSERSRKTLSMFTTER
jgi:hypothetical protein